MSATPATDRPAASPLPAFHRVDAPPSWQAIDFISDLHLCPELPRTVEAWREAMLETDADAVYLLGDIFEVWVGDDARHAPFEAACLSTLREVSRHRVVGVMVGNRDFLLGDAALADAGAVALPDPTLLEAFGRRVLLTHGDALCLDDVDYQAFRRQVRHPAWQQAFLSQPLERRLEQARQLRAASEARKAQGRPETYADLDPAQTLDWLHAAGSSLLIHGHTHRPGDERLAPGVMRHVLTDWDLDDDARPRAEVLRLTADGIERRPLAPSFAMIFDAWRRHRERRVLERRAIPDPLWALTLARFPFLCWRSEADLAELRRLATLFLAEKEFHGAGGLEISDEIAVAVAAQACLPVLRLGLAWYDRSTGIVIHPDEVVARRSVADEDGVVHEYDEVLSGEAMGGGPVMLSWRDVTIGAEADPWAYNVVLHEFAHVIDMRDGEADGLPPITSPALRERWRDAIDEALDQLDARASAELDSCLDPYAAEAPEELFAVAVEAFFVTPHAFAAEYPTLYALFSEFFRQDPQSTAPVSP